MLQYNLLGISQSILLLAMILALSFDSYTTKNLGVIYALIAINTLTHSIHESFDGISVAANLLTIVYSKLPH